MTSYSSHAFWAFEFGMSVMRYVVLSFAVSLLLLGTAFFGFLVFRRRQP